MSAGLNVSPAQVSRSYHDLSYSKLFDIDCGVLYPVMHDECVPGDVVSIGAEFVVRANPLMTPILHRLDVKVDYFFVPYRILMGRNIGHPEEGEWEDFITGGKDGKANVVLPRAVNFNNVLVNGLWDSFGFGMFKQGDPAPANFIWPLAFPFRAYNLIWNEYYRDEDLDDEADITIPMNTVEVSGGMRHSRWEKDYFTSARPWQQKGDPLAFPIALQGSVNFPAEDLGGGFVFNSGSRVGGVIDSSGNFLAAKTGEQLLGIGSQRGILGAVTGNDVGPNRILAVNDLNNNELQVSNSSTFDVADLRFIVQAQRWMERNARAGNRYTEFLKAHFGVYPNDARLQRPEYIGGIRSPIIISEVLQTSETTPESPQGNLAGHGITFDTEHVGKYRVEEFGLIMGIFRIMPKPVYVQGINRQWLRVNRFDFYMPEFAHLSEQEILTEEIYVKASDATRIFGFQGRYNEMRFKQNLVTGNMRDSLKFWHMARFFDSEPVLNTAFLRLSGPEFRKDVFQVPSESGFIVHFGNKLDFMRPIPVDPEPGMMDHI